MKKLLVLGSTLALGLAAASANADHHAASTAKAAASEGTHATSKMAMPSHPGKAPMMKKAKAKSKGAHGKCGAAKCGAK